MRAKLSWLIDRVNVSIRFLRVGFIPVLIIFRIV